MIGRWGTWEELLLGGAIIRHGTEDWNLIAVELRDKIASPYNTATPEVLFFIFFDNRYYYLFNLNKSEFSFFPKKNMILFYKM